MNSKLFYLLQLIQPPTNIFLVGWFCFSGFIFMIILGSTINSHNFFICQLKSSHSVASIATDLQIWKTKEHSIVDTSSCWWKSWWVPNCIKTHNIIIVIVTLVFMCYLIYDSALSSAWTLFFSLLMHGYLSCSASYHVWNLARHNTLSLSPPQRVIHEEKKWWSSAERTEMLYITRNVFCKMVGNGELVLGLIVQPIYSLEYTYTLLSTETSHP